MFAVKFREIKYKLNSFPNTVVQLNKNISIPATISCYSFGSVDTSSSSPFSHGKIYNKGEPLKFPIPVQSDSDDIIDGRELLEAKFHEDWMSADKRQKNLEKIELKEFDKNETVIDIVDGVLLVDHVDNSSKGIEAVNSTAA